MDLIFDNQELYFSKIPFHGVIVKDLENYGVYSIIISYIITEDDQFFYYTEEIFYCDSINKARQKLESIVGSPADENLHYYNIAYYKNGFIAKRLINVDTLK